MANRNQNQKRTKKVSSPLARSPINLANFQSFMKDEHVSRLRQRYMRDVRLARGAISTIIEDLYDIDEIYSERPENSGMLFTSISGRVKEENSFFEKMYFALRESKEALTQDNLVQCYESIHDLCGLRFSVPYYDRVRSVISEIVRPELREKGYAVDLQETKPDRDYLDNGDDRGYRSYHFFIQVPTVIDIYGTEETCLCEVQARTELQQIWAQRSHDLIYKPGGLRGQRSSLPDAVIEDMRHISNNLRSIDHSLVNIRKNLNKDQNNG